MVQGSAIAVRGLRARYRSVEALRDISVTLSPGRLTAIIGPNGAGKSTFMKAMLGLIPTEAGTVIYGDRPLIECRDRVAYVPQRSQVDLTYPATVAEVVLMGRTRQTGWFRGFSATSRQRVRTALERVELWDLRDRPIGALSGGQQQRAFLARSLAQGAEVFFFDEPLVGVDRRTEAIVLDVFQELAAAGHTVVVVNHDLGDVMARFDEVVLLNRELIAAGHRRFVLNDELLSRAYGGRVDFFQGAA
ncbi:MAG: metal ABC transporter ATP-binding protein [Cyanobacteria bacterium]|nr:metal ABC transporter ATP-binding protein [Cyanobacteriota bacterium]